MTNLSFTAYIQSDNENGEVSVRQAPANLVPPSVPPKPGNVSINKNTHKHKYLHVNTL